ncbi:hypothetical protein BJF78_24635 [Pseudonocardia sp. CNS-139]|nr:hypothetical protein BJF78_24635 [Pseudonocardia sp. CNS-139]
MDILILLALVAAGVYVVVAVIWPLKRCRWCSGTGRWRSPFDSAWRPCGRCGGSGRRVRLGRQLYEAFRRD